VERPQRSEDERPLQVLPAPDNDGAGAIHFQVLVAELDGGLTTERHDGPGRRGLGFAPADRRLAAGAGAAAGAQASRRGGGASGPAGRLESVQKVLTAGHQVPGTRSAWLLPSVGSCAMFSSTLARLAYCPSEKPPLLLKSHRVFTALRNSVRVPCISLSMIAASVS